MTGITMEMTGNQLSCHFTQENRLKMNGKKIDYLPSSPLLSVLQHMGLHPLQDCKERRGLERNKNITKLEELVHFLQESTGVMHPL
jgi:hypothetical protein